MNYYALRYRRPYVLATSVVVGPTPTTPPLPAPTPYPNGTVVRLLKGG